MNTTVQQDRDQSVFDLCLAKYGTLDGLAEMAKANSSLHDQSGWPKQGQAYKVSAVNEYRKAVTDQYERRGVKPASLGLPDDPNPNDPLTDDLNTPLTDEMDSILY